MATTPSDLVLPGKVDLYNGVSVDTAALPAEASVFDEQLTASLARWRQEGRRGLWLRIPIGLSQLVPVAAKASTVFISPSFSGWQMPWLSCMDSRSTPLSRVQW